MHVVNAVYLTHGRDLFAWRWGVWGSSWGCAAVLAEMGAAQRLCQEINGTQEKDSGERALWIAKKQPLVAWTCPKAFCSNHPGANSGSSSLSRAALGDAWCGAPDSLQPQWLQSLCKALASAPSMCGAALQHHLCCGCFYTQTGTMFTCKPDPKASARQKSKSNIHYYHSEF